MMVQWRGMRGLYGLCNPKARKSIAVPLCSNFSGNLLADRETQYHVPWDQRSGCRCCRFSDTNHIALLQYCSHTIVAWVCRNLNLENSHLQSSVLNPLPLWDRMDLE